MRRLILFSLLLAACAAPATTAPGGVILQDDFSQAASGWDSHTSADLTTDYRDGQYLIAVEQTGVDVWGNPGLDLADVEIEVEARYLAGPANNEFGLTCRQARQGDQNRFYFFLISSDGYYAAGKVVDNQRTVLHPADGSFQPAEAILLDSQAVNHLRARCAGNKMSFWVNDALVGEFEDGALAHGDIGLIAGAFDEPGVQIVFDNLVARQP